MTDDMERVMVGRKELEELHQRWESFIQTAGADARTVDPIAALRQVGSLIRSVEGVLISAEPTTNLPGGHGHKSGRPE